MEPILVVKDLTKSFREGRTEIRAVNGISFSIDPGEAVGLVGESGCGKTTTARCILRLTEPSSGAITFSGTELLGLTKEKMRAQRRHMQMVFQDPTTSLNPRFTVRRTLAEPLALHGFPNGKLQAERLEQTLARVNLDTSMLDRYPHQLSGGQKQRVGIARAIITEPQFVVLDEPTSSLDMSIRIYIIGLLKRLQQELRMTYLFISHDLSTVRHLCNRVLVMYLGRIVEMGPTEEIFSNPCHVYTRALLSAVPIPDPEYKKQRIFLGGETPSARQVKPGCPLIERCPFALPECEAPQPLYDLGKGHLAACRLAKEQIRIE
jgi:oligopeptide/dipeptide ABC transporter ATP-binding protein